MYTCTGWTRQLSCRAQPLYASVNIHTPNQHLVFNHHNLIVPILAERIKSVAGDEDHFTVAIDKSACVDTENNLPTGATKVGEDVLSLC